MTSANPNNTGRAPQRDEPAFGERWKDAAKPLRPSIANIQAGGDGRRKSSIQFNTAPAEETIRRESTMSVPRASVTRRITSPPPPQTYQRGVTFDTFDNKDASDYSFTLQYKHRDYVHSRRSRTFLCGTDHKDYSEFALEWLLDELVDDGDEIVCLRVVEKDSKVASDASVESGRYREEAQKLLDNVIQKNSHDEKAISMIMELAVGKVQEVIQRMIQIYEPAVLIVGTRGRSLGGMQGLLPGSVSKYCLQQSPIPVIVVRPSTKRMRKKEKRLSEVGRSSYGNILQQAQTRGGSHVLDKNVINSAVGRLPEATDQEAAAVAKAIGLPRNYRGAARLARVTSGRSDLSSDADSPSPTEGFLPAGYLRAAAPIRADLAFKDAQIAALADEDWDEDETDTKGKDGNDDAVETDGEGTGPSHHTENRRSSHGPKPDWLTEILKKDDRREYGRSRSR